MPAQPIFTPDEWEQIKGRWQFIRTILPEIDKAIEDHNQGQLWASLKSVSEKTGDMAEGVVARMLNRAKEELLMTSDDAKVIIHMLVGRNPQFEHLYWHSAYFKTAIDAVVRDFLPAMIAGFAAQAEDRDEQLRNALRAETILGQSLGIEDIRKWLSSESPPPDAL